MLINFDEIIEVVLHHEGGYVNDPDDPGGETNFGIAKRSHPDVDIANLTKGVKKESLSIIENGLRTTTLVILFLLFCLLCSQTLTSSFERYQ